MNTDPEEHQLWCIVFIASTNKVLSTEGAKQVLEAALADRTELGLTGIIIYKNGKDLSLIEGPRAVVKSYFRLKAIHPVHHTIRKVYDGEIAARFFGEYPLAVKVIGRQFRKLDTFQAPEIQETFQFFLNNEHKASKAVLNFINSRTNV